MTDTPTLRYTQPTDVEYDSMYDPDGQPVTGYVTNEVADGTFAEAVYSLVLKWCPRPARGAGVLMTTRACWSGYSDMTVTNRWSEIVLTVPAAGWEHEWPSLGAFLRDLADANPEADR